MLLRKLSIAVGMAVAASQGFADGTHFDDFTPMTGDTAAGSLPEAAPFVLSSTEFRQVNIVTRDPSQQWRSDSGNYDMHTVNENGPDAGRYLFSPFETGQAGIQRTDLRNMQTETIWFAPGAGSHVSFDASRWTPWGSYLTAEESWSDPGQPPSNHGRPEDLEIKTLRNGRQQLYVATTTNHKVFAIDLFRNEVKLFASRDTADMATGAPVGGALANPDNLAIDADGNIYIVEDQPGGREDTWFAVDSDDDGVAEAIGKWASLTTPGAEATGLYFDPFHPHIAYVNVQHPDSEEDRTIMLMAPAVKSDNGKHLGKE